MKVITADDAARHVRSGDTLLIGGSGGGHAVPEALIAAIERRFLAEREPRALTSIHPVGLGDRGDRGVSRFAHDGMLKRIVCGTLVDSPRVEELALADKVEAYTLPQGALSQLTREMAAGRPSRTPASIRSSIRGTAEGGKAPLRAKISSSWSRSTGANGSATSRSTSTSLCCAARPPTKTAMSRWSTRRSSARCCRWRRPRVAPARSSWCRSSALRCAARCRRSR
jgi:hypothetical protein